MSNTNQPIVNSELSNHLNVSLNQQLPQFDLNEIYSTMINNELLNFDTNVHFNESFVWALIDEQLQTDDHIDDIPSNQLCVNADQDMSLDFTEFTPNEMAELLNDTNVCLPQPTIEQLSLAQFDSIFSEELTTQQQQLTNAETITNSQFNSLFAEELQAELLG
jgi:hypothetical protein